MRILTRYVLFDLLKVFLLTLTGLTLLIFVVLIGKEAVDKGIGLGPLLRMAPYLLPQAMQFAVPGTMLLATTSVYGRMASYNEIVAIKSLGISPMVRHLADAGAGHAGELRRRRAQRRGRELGHGWACSGCFWRRSKKSPTASCRCSTRYNLGKANITVRDVDGHRLIWPTLIIQSSGDEPATDRVGRRSRAAPAAGRRQARRAISTTSRSTAACQLQRSRTTFEHTMSRSRS